MAQPAAWTTSLESVLESVEVAEEAVKLFAKEAGFGESEQFFLGLAVREIVINAIVHGNRRDASKRIGFGLSMEDQTLSIEVSDEGNGFQIESVEDPGLPQNQDRPSGRGITMAMAIVDEFHVQGNTPTGTRIHMKKHLTAKA
jgi:serine/threonine-protein kinase RsbW